MLHTLVVVMEKVPARLRGVLALWLVDIRAGVYVGDYSIKVREMIWSIVEREFSKVVTSGSVVMMWSTNNDAGYDLKMLGDNRRTPIDVDGVKLISFV